MTLGEFKTNIRNELLEKRSKLSEKSLQSYISTLSNIPKRMGDKDLDITDVKYFSRNHKQIIEYLKNVPENKRKSILSPLVVITGIESYKDLMKIDIEKFNKMTEGQEKSKKEKVNWIDWNDVLEFHSKLKAKVQYNIKSKDYDMELITDYVLLSMYIYRPARRSLDYADMKIRNFTKEDNYIDLKKKTINYADYKTRKTYGIQNFDISEDNELIKLIKQWMKINKSDYLLIEPHTSSQITKRMNRIFKSTTRVISINMLRHSFLTHTYSSMNSMPTLEFMKMLSEHMGHSLETAMTYIKKE